MVLHAVSCVLDTNVLVAGLYSRNGASFCLLQHVVAKRVQPVISVPLLLEYEEVLIRRQNWLGLNTRQIDTILNTLVMLARPVEIHYLWRPWLPDPKDDMVLEAAFTGQAQCIVTHNVRDFKAAEKLGIEVLPPQKLVRSLEG